MTYELCPSHLRNELSSSFELSAPLPIVIFPMDIDSPDRMQLVLYLRGDGGLMLGDFPDEDFSRELVFAHAFDFMTVYASLIRFLCLAASVFNLFFLNK